LPIRSISFRVAVAQFDTKLGDVRSNLNSIRRISQQIARRKNRVDFVCFPELSTTGYALGRKWKDLADEIPGKVTDELSNIAMEGGFYLICGVDERGGGKEEMGHIYDSAVLIHPNGKLLGVYRKVHLWADERNFFSRGESFPVFETKFCTIGIGICYDLEFPESARVLARKGAKLVFFPSAEPLTAQKQVRVYLKSRSAENCIFTAFSNRLGKERKLSFFGESQINSPDTKILGLASGKQSFVSAKIDLGLLERQEKLLPYLNELEPVAYSV
jgi:predicted amidohydrolase